MAVIKAQKIPRPYKKVSPEDVIAQFCYHYQQYTFAQARKLPMRRINQMMRVAEREYAKKMFDFLQIIASQHTKKMKGMNELSDHYKSILDK